MTNQASEDELATNIDKIIEYWDFSPLQDEDSRIERVHKEIESIIRTEKLKLLAEVRERVVGNVVCTCGCNFRDGCLCLDKSELRTEQHDLLNKLEAGL